MIFSRTILVLFTVALVLGSTSCTKDEPQFEVEYEVRLQSLWSVDSHPVDYPATAALGPFVAFSHKLGTDAFTPGLICTEGIRLMAEINDVTTLEEEVDAFRGGDRALDRDRGISVSFLRTSVVRLGFSEKHNLLTLIAKISPSPDWFVAAKDVELYSGGVWADSLVVYPEAYDAGTDRGQTFVAADIPANPKDAIQVIKSQPLADNGVVAPLGSITLVRVK